MITHQTSEQPRNIRCRRIHPHRPKIDNPTNLIAAEQHVIVPNVRQNRLRNAIQPPQRQRVLRNSAGQLPKPMANPLAQFK